MAASNFLQHVIKGALNVGKLFIGGSAVTATVAELNSTTGRATTATLTPAAGATNVSLVSIQLKDANGTSIATVTPIRVWLSDASTGIGLTTTTASGAVTAGASGTDHGATTSKKALNAATNAAGLFILSITDTAKTGFYVCVGLPNGKVVVSSQLVTGNYG